MCDLMVIEVWYAVEVRCVLRGGDEGVACT